VTKSERVRTSGVESSHPEKHKEQKRRDAKKYYELNKEKVKQRVLANYYQQKELQESEEVLQS
jgi:ribosomal protein S15P/S13E